MSTEFNDSQHFGFFMTGTTLTSSTGKYLRQSELVLAALRAQGVFDNMVDGTVPPATDKLWLDKNTDPAVLKEWDPTGSAWAPMTFQRLFGRAIVTAMATPTGTANALVVAQPSPFIPNRMYSLAPVLDNTGAATIQVTGVGTFAVKYTDGTDIEAQEFKAGSPTILLFTGSRFEVIFKVADVYAASDTAVAAAASVNIKNVENRTALKSLNTMVTTLSFLREGGREGLFKWTSGNFSTQIAADTQEGLYIKADAIASTAGAWVRQGGWAVSGAQAEWFGAIADYNTSTGGGTDNTPAFNAAFAIVPFVTAGRGYFKVSGSGITVPPYGRLFGVSNGYASQLLDSTSWDTAPGTVLVPRSMTQSHTINAMITQCELSGGKLANPNAGAAYTTSSGTRLNNYFLTDFTNQNASGATAATPRAFSVVVKMKHGALIRGIHIRTTRTGGSVIDPQSSDTNFGDAPDIGILAENPFNAQIDNCSTTWVFRIANVAALTYDAGDGYQPQGDRFKISNCDFRGHTPLIVRNYDVCPVSAVSATEIRTWWFKSHRFPPTGSIIADGVTYTYSSLTYDGVDELVFGGLSANPVTNGLQVGDELYRGEDASNFGFGGLTVENSFIRTNFAPNSLLSTDGTFSDRFDFSGKAFELSGRAVRGIHFRNVYIHTREDIIGFIHDAGDIYIGGYHEGKVTSVGDPAARFIALSLAAKAAGVGSVPHPFGEATNVHFIDWSQTESSTDRTPTFRTSATIGRFGTTDGLFEPNITSADDYAYAQGTTGTPLLFRGPKVRGDGHEIILKNAANSNRASMDSTGRWAFGILPSGTTDAVLPQIGNFFNSGGCIVLARNVASATATGFRADNTGGTADFIADGAGNAAIRIGGTQHFVGATTVWRSQSDNDKSCGSASFRWTQLFAATATIGTSDEREKEFIEGIRDVVLDAWGQVEWVQFKMRDAVERKGDGARLHFGLIAQRVRDVFESNGLDPFAFGLLCYDKWDDEWQDVYEEVESEEPVINPDGSVSTTIIVKEVATGEKQRILVAGDRFGLRYEECFALEAAYQRRRISRIEASLNDGSSSRV
ncbi:tail fiber domain-containing protein [Ensifer aridi]|uniref:tail fiber domain-containing protein n=1 Tax=Ensifer aridi TaxID=1708715 RepID=UPI00041E4AA4|nr:tail fiber domain-containing protein [Ensifer aridi]